MHNSTGLAFNSVDTFFFLSGFLATWAMLEKYIRPPGSKPIAPLKVCACISLCAIFWKVSVAFWANIRC